MESKPIYMETAPDMLKQLGVPLRSIYNHTSLLNGFITRDIKGRFAASFGGLIWTILTPLATIIAYFFVFSLVLKITVTSDETGTDRFVIYFLCGFFPWAMFAESLTKSVNILINESSIITKVVLPVELLPISTVLTSFLINCIGFVLFLIYLVIAGYANLNWFFIPIAIFIEIVFVLGLAFFLSALCVFIRDIGELLNIIIMLWFFGTPVIYPLSLVPERFEFVYFLNPMVKFITFYRDLILMNKLDLTTLIIIFCYAVVSYSLGTWFFLRSKSAFGDVL